ncbi:MAG: RsiV family protein [Oscillospiraceae bacterium]|nr:RsiV family protein [Oscillospiraceae bacterium]
MRNIAGLVCVCALACGLFACGPAPGAAYQPKYNGEPVPVRQGEVVTGKVTFPDFLSMLERKQGLEYKPLKKSYIAQRQQAYQGYFYRIAYYAFPRFTGELSGPGGRKIKRFYRDQYRACDPKKEFDCWLDGLETVPDTADEIIKYVMQVYAVELLDGYVAVAFTTESHTGGGKVTRIPSADVFDRNTGERLSLGDVVELKAAAQAINRAVADDLRIRDIRPFEPYDISKAADQPFTLTENGIVLLFPADTLAPVAYGPLEIPISWGTLEG